VPPRYAYWTILIDNGPTAFRARRAEELLPTLNQLKRTNANIVMRWFARGRLWDSPEAARAALRNPEKLETRGKGWRPGGQHRDPRARPPRDVRRAKHQRAAASHADPDRRRQQPARSARPGGQRKPWRKAPPTGRLPEAHGKPVRRKRDDEPPDRD
jgi:hypothetical protein